MLKLASACLWSFTASQQEPRFMRGVTLDDRDMKYYCAMLTHGITRQLDFMLLAVAVALGCFGLNAWVILRDSQAPLVESLGVPAASWLVALILGLILRPFPTKLTGKVDATAMKGAIAKKTMMAFCGITWPALILFVLAFLLHLPRAFVLLAMIAHGATLFLLLRSTDQRLEQFAETWCGDHYNPANPEIDTFLHGTRSVSFD